MALEMRAVCERCGAALSADGPARICSFECTFCEKCASGLLGGVCPNCSGELVRRPRRSAAMLAKYPPSAERVLKAAGCAPAL